MKQRFLDFGRDLRGNLVRNLFKEYERTGALWEQYNQDTGRGQRSKPFTGWSSLVLLMMQKDFEFDDFILDSELWDFGIDVRKGSSSSRTTRDEL